MRGMGGKGKCLLLLVVILLAPLILKQLTSSSNRVSKIDVWRHFPVSSVLLLRGMNAYIMRVTLLLYLYNVIIPYTHNRKQNSQKYINYFNDISKVITDCHICLCFVAYLTLYRSLGTNDHSLNTFSTLSLK